MFLYLDLNLVQTIRVNFKTQVRFLIFFKAVNIGISNNRDNIIDNISNNNNNDDDLNDKNDNKDNKTFLLRHAWKNKIN